MELIVGIRDLNSSHLINLNILTVLNRLVINFQLKIFWIYLFVD